MQFGYRSFIWVSIIVTFTASMPIRLVPINFYYYYYHTFHKCAYLVIIFPIKLRWSFKLFYSLHVFIYYFFKLCKKIFEISIFRILHYTSNWKIKKLKIYQKQTYLFCVVQMNQHKKRNKYVYTNSLLDGSSTWVNVSTTLLAGSTTRLVRNEKMQKQQRSAAEVSSQKEWCNHRNYFTIIFFELFRNTASRSFSQKLINFITQSIFGI